MVDRLKDRVVIVTGAAQGIGEGIARLFASEGAKIVIADIDVAAGRRLSEELSGSGADTVFVEADISVAAECEAMAETAVARYGRIDILCQNAGIYPEVSIENMTTADWDRVHSVNLRGMFLTVKACLPIMKTKKYGRIVVTSSITGPITGNPGLAHYGATKGGINGFMRTAAIEFAPYGITMNAVAPGNILTPGIGAAMGEDYVRAQARSIPLRRLGSPEDVAYATLFLASDEASYITGQTIVVDGGQVLPESPSTA